MRKHEPTMSRLESAIMLATQYHAGQVYGKPPGRVEPYILHPLRVMLRVEPGPLMVVAVLHDIVEDTPYELGRLYQDFPQDIAAAVDAISHRKDEDYWRYIDRVKANELARIVKIADLFENLSRMNTLSDGKHRAELEPKYRQAIRLLST